MTEEYSTSLPPLQFQQSHKLGMSRASRISVWDRHKHESSAHRAINVSIPHNTILPFPQISMPGNAAARIVITKTCMSQQCESLVTDPSGLTLDLSQQSSMPVSNHLSHLLTTHEPLYESDHSARHYHTVESKTSRLSHHRDSKFKTCIVTARFSGADIMTGV